MANQIHELFAYLIVGGAEQAIEFYTKAFGATEKYKLRDPSGRIGHAELDFGGATLMLADEFPEVGVRSPKTVGGASVTIHLHVDNADEMIAKAVELGATVDRPVQDQFHGERSGAVIDPFGHRWLIGHTIEQVTPEEMQRRYDAQG